MSEDVETLLKAWTTAFSEEVLDYAQPPEVRDEEVSYILFLIMKLSWRLLFLYKVFYYLNYI